MVVPRNKLWLVFAFVPAFLPGTRCHALEERYTCSKSEPCQVGCCGPLDEIGTGFCGFGPEFCGESCTSSCDEKSECDPGWGYEWSKASTCPLNVCCSKFSFCGTTADFCGDQVPLQPQCDPAARSSDFRMIGYFQGWNLARPCVRMPPKEIPLGVYTDLYFSFLLINPEIYRLDDMGPGSAALYSRVASLNLKQPDLKVWVAVGGWAMNEPGPYQKALPDMACSEANQDAFIDSLITFMRRYNLDGVNLDWEYPVAADRGGEPGDFDNYVTLLRRLRERLNASGRTYGISISTEMEPYIDYFNVMTYDLHETWDEDKKEIGAYAYSHMNLTMIEEGLELFWRKNINPQRITLGLGFYGRSFTMKDPNCMDAGCEYIESVKCGECTGTPGVLSAVEINKIIKNGAKVRVDEKAATIIVTWDENQWVSFDNAKTLGRKVDYANKRCLGGTMVWSVDIDDGTLIETLAESIGRPKQSIMDVANWPTLIPDLGTIPEEHEDL